MRLLDANRHPKRQYQAKLMLSPHGLYEDLNADGAPEGVMLAFDGNRSVLDIADELGISFEWASYYTERFAETGLVSLQLGPARVQPDDHKSVWIFSVIGPLTRWSAVPRRTRSASGH